MITIYGERHKPNEPVFKDMPARRQVDLCYALTTLLEYELGFGGKVTEITEDGGQVTIKTVTRVLACTDYTYFSGTKLDMEPLCRVVAAWAAIMRDKGQELAEGVAKSLEGRFSTLVSTSLSSMMLGTRASFVALMLAFEVPTETAKRMTRMPLRDVIAAVCLSPGDPLSVLG